MYLHACKCIDISIEGLSQMYLYRSVLFTPYNTALMRSSPPISSTVGGTHYYFVLLPFARKYKNIRATQCRVLSRLSYDLQYLSISNKY